MDVPRCSALILLIIAGGFFAAAETAFSYCNKIRMKTLAEEEGNRKARRVLKILDDFDSGLATLLIGTNIIHVAASSIATVLAITICLDETVASVLSTVIMTVLVFFFSETIPKSIAKENCDSVAMALALPLQVLMTVFFPVSKLFSLLSDLLKKIFSRGEQTPTVTEDEFQDIVNTIEEEGVLEHDETQIIQSAIEFSDKTVREVMRPKEEMVCIDVNTPPSELKSFILSMNYSRIPVYEDSIDNIIGFIQAEELLESYMENRHDRVREKLRKTFKVSPVMRLNALFEQMGRRRTHIAIVSDSDGKTLGLVTMEDIIEEIVGEIYDEDEAGEGASK